MSRLHLHLLIAGFMLLLSGSPVSAQVRVELEFARRLYVVYEPLIATVTITNLTGRDLELHDEGGKKWFGFEITSLGGLLVSPTDPDYQLGPFRIGAGQSATRKINITPLYRLGEFGTYKMRATIWSAENDRYYTSPMRQVDITEGKIFWQETVGMPDGTGSRTYSLLTHRTQKDTRLYVRVEDRENGVVYATAHIGRYLSFAPAQYQIDVQNTLHILQLVSPKTFLYTHIGLDGQILAHEPYVSTALDPHLKRGVSGDVHVAGGALQLTEPSTGPAPSVPKLSDRPVPLPKP